MRVILAYFNFFWEGLQAVNPPLKPARTAPVRRPPIFCRQIHGNKRESTCCKGKYRETHGGLVKFLQVPRVFPYVFPLKYVISRLFPCVALCSRVFPCVALVLPLCSLVLPLCSLLLPLVPCLRLALPVSVGKQKETGGILKESRESFRDPGLRKIS